MKSIAVVASSGGGTATLGHSDPVSLLQTINDQLWSIGGTVSHALYVNLDGGKSMDTANEDIDSATLYQVVSADGYASNETDSVSAPSLASLCRAVKRGTLKEVNVRCSEEQKTIAKAVLDGKVDGLICK